MEAGERARRRFSVLIKPGAECCFRLYLHLDAPCSQSARRLCWGARITVPGQGRRAALGMAQYCI